MSHQAITEFCCASFRKKWKPDSSDSDSVELTPPIFDFHWVLSSSYDSLASENQPLVTKTKTDHARSCPGAQFHLSYNRSYSMHWCIKWWLYRGDGWRRRSGDHVETPCLTRKVADNRKVLSPVPRGTPIPGWPRIKNWNWQSHGGASCR